MWPGKYRSLWFFWRDFEFLFGIYPILNIEIPEFYWRPALRLLRDSLEDYARFKMTLRPNADTSLLEGPMLERCVFLINRVQSLMHNLGWLVEHSAQRGSPAGAKLLEALSLSSMLTITSNEAPLLALLKHLVPE